MALSRRDFLIGSTGGVLGAAVAGALVSVSRHTDIYSALSPKQVDVFDYRKLAKKRLPKIVFDFLEGGSGDERSIKHNLEVFKQLDLAPRRMVDISKRDQSVRLFGKAQPLPFLIAPTGGNGALWPDGDIALAKAAAKAGIPFSLSTASTNSIEDVAKAVDGDQWFQLYVSSEEQSRMLLNRALKAGYSTLIVTVDVEVNGLRYRDARNGFKLPMPKSVPLLIDGITHPRWTWDYLTHGEPTLGNFASASGSNDLAAQQQAMSRNMDTTFDWAALKKIRDLWPHTMLVKGILNADDAAHCIAIGADGVILSNHGGRQLGEAISPLQVLAETRKKVSAPVLIDSGYRTGADIVKAFALGADAVLLGRATLYGLAARGQTGVSEVLGILQNEVDNTLAQIECPDIKQLNQQYLRPESVAIMERA